MPPFRRDEIPIMGYNCKGTFMLQVCTPSTISNLIPPPLSKTSWPTQTSFVFVSGRSSFQSPFGQRHVHLTPQSVLYKVVKAMEVQPPPPHTHHDPIKDCRFTSLFGSHGMASDVFSRYFNILSPGFWLLPSHC
jgi:hypothetical protein